MAEFVAPQMQYPDILGSYLRGQQGAIQSQMAPGNLAEQGLNIEQLRQTVQSRGLINQYAQQLAGQVSQSGQAPGGASGGVQNGPQAGVSSLSPDRVNTMMALDVLQGRDPIGSAEKAQQYQQRNMQMQLQGPMNLAETVARSPDADKIVYNNPSLLQGWRQFAPMLGLDPNDPKSLTTQNAQKVSQLYYNSLAGQAGLPPKDFGFTGTLKPGEAAFQNGQQVAGSADAITPYQKQEMALRQQEFQLAQHRFAFEQDQSKIPSGYQVSKDDPSKIEPIPGGPKDPSAAGFGGMGGRQAVMTQRVMNAGNSAAESIKNITELPVSASTGWFGTATKGTSLLGSVKGVLTQKVNGQDIQDYQTMLAGVTRNLSTLETAGLAPNGSLTHSMDALTIGQGDTQLTKLRKLAEMRQIVDTNLTPQLSDPKIVPAQKEMIQSIIDKVNKSVPFTHSDITAFEQSKNPRATMMDFAKSSGVQAQADSAHPADVQALLDKYK